jgi:hypothetical protein
VEVEVEEEEQRTENRGRGCEIESESESESESGGRGRGRGTGAGAGAARGGKESLGEALRGRQKKSTGHPVHLLNPRPIHPPADFFLVRCALNCTFGRFSARAEGPRGVQKHHKNVFTKSPCQINKNFDVSFPSISFGFYRVFGYFSAMGVQKHHKKRFTKKSRRKVFIKKSTKFQNRFFSRCFSHVFGRFSVRGVKKHDKKHRKINLTLVLFWPLTHPPTTGVTDFGLFAGPLRGPGPAPTRCSFFNPASFLFTPHTALAARRVMRCFGAMCHVF